MNVRSAGRAGGVVTANAPPLKVRVQEAADGILGASVLRRVHIHGSVPQYGGPESLHLERDL